MTPPNLTLWHVANHEYWRSLRALSKHIDSIEIFRMISNEKLKAKKAMVRALTVSVIGAIWIGTSQNGSLELSI